MRNFFRTVGSIRSVELLLQYGANVDETPGVGQRTALMAAARHKYLDCVKVLADRTKNIDAVNSYGETALFSAAQGT